MARERLLSLGIQVVQNHLVIPEIQALEPKTVASHKARIAANKVDVPFFVEDSGLFIPSLRGFPGALVKIVVQSLGEKNWMGLLQNLRSREATIRSVLIYCEPERKLTKIFTASYTGKVLLKPVGKNARGWLLTKIFAPDGLEMPLAALSNIEWVRYYEKIHGNDHIEKFKQWWVKRLKGI